jgi:hypothetical protein
MKHKLKRVGIIVSFLAAAIFVVWRLELSHRVNRQLAALRARGLPTNGDELNQWHTAVPDSENAALVMVEAFELRQEYPTEQAKQWSGFALPPRGQLLPEETRQFLAGYVEMNAAALNKVNEAIRLPRSRYPIDHSWGVNTPLPHLTSLKRLAAASEYEAVLALGSNQPAVAADSTLRILGMARTLNGEPLVISQLVRVSMLDIAADTLQRTLALNGLEEEQLSTLSIQFAAAETNGSMARALIGERAMYIPYFRMSRAEAERISQASEDGDKVPNGPPLPGGQPLLMRVSGFFERDLSFYLTAMETNITLISDGPPLSLRSGPLLEKAGDEAHRRFYLMSSMTLASYAKVAQREAHCIATLRLAETALAIEQFRHVKGTLPQGVNELVPGFLPVVPTDPFDGQPLRYRRLEKGYVIYSVDRDRRDDGGKERPARVKSTDKTSYDLTFTVER